MTSGATSAASERLAPLAELPLTSLLEELDKGSPGRTSAAAVELIRRFQPLIRKFWRLQQCGDYEDFFQDVLLRTFSSLPHLRNHAAFPGFLRRIVVTTAADYWRRQSLHERHLLNVDVENIERAFDQDLATPLIVRSMLDRLPPREREVIALTYFEDMDSGEIARLMGLSAGAVRMTKSRAINKLRELLAAEESR